MSRSEHHRVVVIGAGFGGLRVAPRAPRRAGRGDDRRRQQLPHVPAAALPSGDRRARHRRHRLPGARDLPPATQRVGARRAGSRASTSPAGSSTTDRGAPLAYDTLVVAAGTISHDFGDPRRRRAHPPAQDRRRRDRAPQPPARPVRGRMRSTATPSDGALDVVVCGGGPTGVEMAGGLAELYQRVLARDFPQLDVAGARITLVEAAPHVLGTFHESLGERARRTLTERGIEVVTGVPVERVEPGAVHLANGRTLVARTVVWAAGVRANPLAELLGVELGRGGRIVVQPDLSVPGHPDVFAIGDIAIDPGTPLPQVAQPAIQGGAHVAEQIVRRIDGRTTEPFRYHDKGSMATIGRHHAVAEFPERHAAPRRGRVARVARAPHRLPDGVPQPRQRARQLGLELPHLRPRLTPARRPHPTPNRVSDHGPIAHDRSHRVSGVSRRGRTRRRWRRTARGTRQTAGSRRRRSRR